MKLLNTVSILFLALSALAVPLDNVDESAKCTITATWELDIVIGGGGPGQAPVSNTRTGFNLAKAGAKTKYITANSIGRGDHKIKGADLGLKYDVVFTSDFRTSSFHDCSAKYGSGAEVQGKPGGGNCKASQGSSCASCAVTFDCLLREHGAGADTRAAPPSQWRTPFNVPSVAAPQHVVALAVAQLPTVRRSASKPIGRTHKHLCGTFRKISESALLARPSPTHYLVIYFPMVNKRHKPSLQWVRTKEESGFFEPELDQMLTIPGHPGYIGQGMQIIRGNILRGRPKFPDSLNLRYVDDFVIQDALRVNETLHGGPEAVCADGWGEFFWKGPIVAFLKAGNDFDAPKMKDINLTAYRDAVDYLAYYRDTIGSMIDGIGMQTIFSKRVMEQKTGKVKGVRINCIRDQDGDVSRQFVQVNVPKSHPLFEMESDDPLEIVSRLGEAWVMKRYHGPRNATVEDNRNTYATMLLRHISKDYLDREDWANISEWRQSYTSGSVLVALAHFTLISIVR
ncbi:hypothetical protein K491DRAFT_756836 [Lophiostoma macrostomum CBS 122681]|uniref:Uncharacterized protein n=1 Tax=Lophiostoma macrostomum CBS 122681 TaxID=1314788 RepID=A0A6A6TCN5_9PLEO|nr:hypothetical protein K491DRAFT_756836 [Lophiostoma macrostomum CBS 122681]